MEIVVFGDIMIQGAVAARLAREGREGLVASLRERIGDADLAIGNFETFLCPPGHEPDGPWFSPMEAADVVAEAGFHAVSVATNHTWDHGQPSVEYTLATLTERGVGTVGLGGANGKSPTGILLEAQGQTIGVLNYATASNVIKRPCYTGVAPSREMPSDIRALAADCDGVIVLIHHGEREYPSPELCQWAQAAIDAGALAVAVHHSHVASGVAPLGEGVVAYGLGNCVAHFDSTRLQRRECLGLRLEVADGKLQSWSTVTYGTDDDGYPCELSPERQEAFSQRIERISQEIQGEGYAKFYWDEFARESRSQYLRSWKQDLKARGLKTIWEKLRRLRWHHVRILMKMLRKPSAEKRPSSAEARKEADH